MLDNYKIITTSKYIKIKLLKIIYLKKLLFKKLKKLNYVSFINNE